MKIEKTAVQGHQEMWEDFLSELPDSPDETPFGIIWVNSSGIPQASTNLSPEQFHLLLSEMISNYLAASIKEELPN